MNEKGKSDDLLKDIKWKKYMAGELKAENHWE